MSRYLGPAKIGLLVLIELYVEDAIPSDAVMPILSFISSHILDYNPNHAVPWGKAERIVSLAVSIKDFEKLLGSYPFVMNMPGRKLWDQFLKKLWAIDSLDAMHQFFDNLDDLLLKTKEELQEMGKPEETQEGIKLTKTSPFGMIVRRSMLEFDRMRFGDGIELWKDFVRYRQPTAQYLKRKVPGFNRLSFDNVLFTGEQEDWGLENTMELASVAYGDMLTGDRNSKLPVTTHDIETLLEFQIDKMQRYGNRIPLEIRNQFHDLLNDSFVVPSLSYYLSFLDSWRAGDYNVAFDLLHQYFDYTMQNRDRLFYQYALMNLAVLQADFGCYKDAVASMLETVSTARENKDLTCLNFALNWLYHFGRAHPSLVEELDSNNMLGTSKESLAFLRVKAKETGMWTLWSSALLSEAKFSLINGDSVATALEYMVRSSHLIVERNMKSMFGSQMGLTTAFWDRLGIAPLSLITLETFLRCHTEHSIFDDELKLTCRFALLLAQRGKYNEALEKLETLDSNSLRSWKAEQYLLKYRGIIQLKRELHINNLVVAEHLLSELLQSKVDDIEPDMAFLLDTAHIDYLTRKGDLQTAFAKVETMMANLKDESKDISLRVRLLVLKATLLDKCNRTNRGFSHVMRAANISYNARLVPHLWYSLGALANILVSKAEFKGAIKLLRAILPRTLECNVPVLAAQQYAYLADAYMGLAGSAKHHRRPEFFAKAASALQKGFDLYSALEDIVMKRQMMAKKAVIMKVSGDETLATTYAECYMSMDPDGRDVYQESDEEAVET